MDGSLGYRNLGYESKGSKNKKAGTRPAFPLTSIRRDQYFATTGPPQLPQLKR
ncbi:hypothetical protein SAMN05444158_4544 [Bradyrhizobium canariense]|uniref:Uncharacterized protein n=1 Tax=Bradyrhizobium canariense TaxID=255045 RepID=A0A1H1XYH0_9BRAD|nr:hypothetical protein SAMN05444158_4544 [Bradyrhizobium canariense]